MKTCAHLEIGDHVRVTTTRRGAPNIVGAIADISDGALYLITSSDHQKPTIRILHTEVANVSVMERAPHAIYEQSGRRFDYGMKIVGLERGARFVGEVISAWKGAVLIRTPSGHSRCVRAEDATRAPYAY